jgi:hypothetical protein
MRAMGSLVRLEDLQSFGGEDGAWQSSDQAAAEAPMPRCIILDPGPPTVYQPLRFERVDRYLLAPLYTHIPIFLALSRVYIRLCRSNYTAMAGSSRNSSPVKRLMTELQTYQADPNEALLELGPADDDVMHWRAVMKGVVGTAYEGMYMITLNNMSAMRAVKRAFTCYKHRRLTRHRRSLAPRYPRPQCIPLIASHHSLRNAYLPPKCRLQNRRDLPRSSQNILDPCIHYIDYHDIDTSAPHKRRAGQPAECGHCTVV